VNMIKYSNLMDSKGYRDQKASFGPKKVPQQYDFFEKIDFSSLFWCCVIKYLSYITNSTKLKKKYAKKCTKKITKCFFNKFLKKDLFGLFKISSYSRAKYEAKPLFSAL
jgi:hypothetical protein